MNKNNKFPSTIKILKTSIHKYRGEEGSFDTRPTQPITHDSEIEKLVEDLPNKDVVELRNLWSRYFDEEIPKWNKGYLTKRLAYRIQEVHYATTIRPKVRTVLEDIYKGRTDLVAKSKLRKEGKFKIKIGTVLERTYKGEIYRVIKTDKGYLFDDKIYQYLSAIAKQITKKETKGYEFFGLI